jgi:hypothetical protein
MGLSNAGRQARWRAKREAELANLRKIATTIQIKKTATVKKVKATKR